MAVPVSFFVGFVSGLDDPSLSPGTETALGAEGIFKEAWHIIADDFYGDLPPARQRVYAAVRGMLDTLDDAHTIFVEPAPRQLERDNLRGSYGGIGAVLSLNSESEIVLSPFRQSPAAEAGILDGDVLLAVDGLRLTPNMDLSNDVVTRIRGEVGTDVRLTIRRDGTERDVVITRQVIKTPSVTWEMLDQAPTLGYVRIQSFTGRTDEELGQALAELLEAENAQGLILDLRGNGGGLLQAAIDVSGHFLDGGTVLYENRRGQDETFYPASSGGAGLDVPLAVLVDHGTASASEIVAGALRDRDRAILIGEQTFGKGTVQLIFDLSDGSSLHVTVAEWLTPGRHPIQDVGLTPDLIVEPEPDNHPDTDLTLERAISYLLQVIGDEWSDE